jgi:hypothetical protein
VTFFLAGVAHAGHVHIHANKVTHGEHTELVCQLCLQFDRAAPPPPTVTLPALSPIIRRTAFFITTSIHAAVSAARYDARGPPHA